MFVKDYLDTFLLEYDHPYSYSVMLKYINQVESNLGDVVKQYLNVYYARTINAFQFSLPNGVTFEDVTKLYVSGMPYKKKDTRAYKEKYSYWYEDSKICIYPACYATDTSFTSGTSEVTFASATITTTGDDFVGFSIGDVVSITGCLLATANNKTATIIGVAAKALTFATGTFSEQAEVAAITVTAPKVKMTYLYKPTTKLIANIATDTLNLVDRWIEIYDYFLMSKIAYLAKDYADSQNHMQMFNNKVADYVNWMESNRPQNPVTDVVCSEEGDYSGSTDFDTEV